MGLSRRYILTFLVITVCSQAFGLPTNIQLDELLFFNSVVKHPESSLKYVPSDPEIHRWNVARTQYLETKRIQDLFAFLQISWGLNKIGTISDRELANILNWAKQTEQWDQILWTKYKSGRTGFWSFMQYWDNTNPIEGNDYQAISLRGQYSTILLKITKDNYWTKFNAPLSIDDLWLSYTQYPESIQSLLQLYTKKSSLLLELSLNTVELEESLDRRHKLLRQIIITQRDIVELTQSTAVRQDKLSIYLAWIFHQELSKPDNLQPISSRLWNWLATVLILIDSGNLSQTSLSETAIKNNVDFTFAAEFITMPSQLWLIEQAGGKKNLHEILIWSLEHLNGKQTLSRIWKPAIEAMLNQHRPEVWDKLIKTVDVTQISVFDWEFGQYARALAAFQDSDYQLCNNIIENMYNDKAPFEFSWEEYQRLYIKSLYSMAKFQEALNASLHLLEQNYAVDTNMMVELSARLDLGYQYRLYTRIAELTTKPSTE